MKRYFITPLLFALSLFLISPLQANDHSSSALKFLLEDKSSYLIPKELKRGDVNAKVLLYKNIVAVEFVTPVYNIHNVDTAPNLRSDEENARVEKAKAKFLADPEKFISFQPIDACNMTSFGYRLEQVGAGAKQSEPHVGKWRHFDVKS